MSTQNHTDITTGAPANASVVNAPLGQLDNALADVELQFGDFVVSGGLAGTSATLVVSQPATRAFVINSWVSAALQNLTMAASNDNYVDLDNTGVYHITSVANGAAIPAVFANSIRLYKAVSNATAVTSVQDFRNLGVVVPQSMLVKGGRPWFDVDAYGASPTNSSVISSTAIQAAINAAHNTARGVGVVYFNAGVYYINVAIQYYGQLTLQGAGMAGIAGGSNAGTVIYLYTGADQIFRSAAPTSIQSNLTVRDIAFDASGNAANTGGVLLTKVQYSTFERVSVANCNSFCWKLLGGGVAGDTAFNNFTSCAAYNVASGGFCVWIQTDAGGLSIAESSRWVACRFNSGVGTTGLRIDKNGTTHAADANFHACNFEAMDTFINSDGTYVQYIGNRFEVTSGNSQVILNPVGTSPGGLFVANTFAVPGTFTFTDNGTTKSTRMGDYETGNVQRFYFPNGALAHSVQTPAFAATLNVDARFGDIVIVGTLTGNITALNAPSNPVLGQEMTWIFTQDATGQRTVAWAAAFKTGWQPGPLANAISSITFVYDGANWQAIATAHVDSGSATTAKFIMNQPGQGLFIWHLAGSALQFLNAAGGTTTLALGGNAGLISTYASIATQGMGVPAIYQAPAPLIGQTAAVASIATLTSPNDGNKHTYNVHGFVRITTLGSGNINLQVTYTDTNGTVQTCTIPLCAEAGTFAASATTADDYKGGVEITVNPNTAITVKTAGTFTGCTYNTGATIKQIQ